MKAIEAISETVATAIAQTEKELGGQVQSIKEAVVAFSDAARSRIDELEKSLALQASQVSELKAYCDDRINAIPKPRDGVDGRDGKDGSMVLTGEGEPEVGGAPGDMYVDAKSGDIYYFVPDNTRGKPTTSDSTQTN